MPSVWPGVATASSCRWITHTEIAERWTEEMSKCQMPWCNFTAANCRCNFNRQETSPNVSWMTAGLKHHSESLDNNCDHHKADIYSCAAFMIYFYPRPIHEQHNIWTCESWASTTAWWVTFHLFSYMETSEHLKWDKRCLQSKISAAK